MTNLQNRRKELIAEWMQAQKNGTPLALPGNVQHAIRAIVVESMRLPNKSPAQQWLDLRIFMSNQEVVDSYLYDVRDAKTQKDNDLLSLVTQP